MTDPAEQAPLVVIGAGGTGGHMFPAAAFAEEMRARGWRVGLVSDVRGLRYASKFPADWKEKVEAASPNLRKPWTLPATALKLNKGVGQAARLLKSHGASLVAGFGGYPAFPALAAAKRLGLPMLIHEQNAVLGRVNRRFASTADEIVGGFERLDRLPAGRKHLPLGNPVRSPIAAKRDTAFPATDGDLRIFITGGSQGARILGEAVPLAIANHLPPELRARVKIVQQVREEQIDSVRAIYEKANVAAELKSFFDDMPDQLANAHLVVARSGAGTVSEIAAIGRPSILIPLKIAMDDHQTANADALVAAGAADLMVEDNLYPKLIGQLLEVRLSDGENLRTRAAAARAAGTITAASDLADVAERVARLKSS
ncbi:MAG: UDP-N-acetylglucosamine--N-acetylmuramyl-(pentapeptide) pyrophosphoryl-undecaprenol N-acetylglucosamine transferase [Hyphomonadaceae bacterium]